MLRAMGPGILVVAASVLLAAAHARAQQQPSAGEVFSEFLACEAVPDPTEQLICFRTALKKYKARFGLLSGRVEDAARENPAALPVAPAGRKTPPPALSAVSPGSAVAAPPPPADASPKAEREYRHALAQATPDRVEGVIVEATRDPLGYWIFTLDNGQVWKEASKSRLRDSSFTGRRATIRKGLFGSWQIKVEGTGASGRVVRIR